MEEKRLIKILIKLIPMKQKLLHQMLKQFPMLNLILNLKRMLLTKLNSLDLRPLWHIGPSPSITKKITLLIVLLHLVLVQFRIKERTY